MNKLEFLNIAKYIAEFKFAIENLYAENKIVMSQPARNDLNRIKAETMIQNFTVPALKQWQDGNQLLEIRSYSDFLNAQFRIIHGVTNPQKSKSPRGKKESGRKLSDKDLKRVEKCFSHWDSFTNMFYDQIENPDTLKLMLKNGETQISMLLGREASLDKNDPVSFYIEKLNRVCDILRARILSMENISPVISNHHAPVKLKANVSVDWIRDVLQQLSTAGYISGAIMEKPYLAEQWYDYAFFTAATDRKSNSTKIVIGWLGTSISLAQFVVRMRDTRVFEDKQSDRGYFYKWVHRCFKCDADTETLEKDIRNAHKIHTQCFEITKMKNGAFTFKVVHKARKAKRRK